MELQTEKHQQVRREIEVKAPVWRVYEAWSHVERFPEFLADIQQVDKISTEKCRWLAKGPDGKILEWFSLITVDVPNSQVAWKSVSGDVHQECEIDMEAVSPMHTRVSLRMDYTAPVENHRWADLIAKLLQQDPGRRLQRDLEAFKRIIENETLTTRSPSTII